MGAQTSTVPFSCCCDQFHHPELPKRLAHQLPGTWGKAVTEAFSAIARTAAESVLATEMGTQGTGVEAGCPRTPNPPNSVKSSQASRLGPVYFLLFPQGMEPACLHPLVLSPTHLGPQEHSFIKRYETLEVDVASWFKDVMAKTESPRTSGVLSQHHLPFFR